MVALRKKREGGGKRARERERQRERGKELSWPLPRSMPILGVSRSRDRSFPLVWPIHSLFPYLALRHWFTFAPAPIGSTEKVLPPLSHRFPLTSPTERRLRERQIGSRFFFFFFHRISFLENRSGWRSFFSRSYRTFDWNL